MKPARYAGVLFPDALRAVSSADVVGQWYFGACFEIRLEENVLSSVILLDLSATSVRRRISKGPPRQCDLVLGMKQQIRSNALSQCHHRQV